MQTDKGLRKPADLGRSTFKKGIYLGLKWWTQVQIEHVYV